MATALGEKTSRKMSKRFGVFLDTRFWASIIFSYDIWSVRLCYFLFEIKILSISENLSVRVFQSFVIFQKFQISSVNQPFPLYIFTSLISPDD